MQHVSINGKIISGDQPIFHFDNRSFKWGDGVFETLRVLDGRIKLFDCHSERLSASLKMLGLKPESLPTPKQVSTWVLDLCEKNHCRDSARVRVTIYRNQQNEAATIIEAAVAEKPPLDWNWPTYAVDFFRDVRKSFDSTSSFKTTSSLPYVLAMRFAEAHQLDDSIILNSFGNVCETSRANIFIITSQHCVTPPVSEGCVDGVMRRFIIQKIQSAGIMLEEKTITEEEFRNADEAFITNAFIGINSIERCGEKKYSTELTRKISQSAYSTYLI